MSHLKKKIKKLTREAKGIRVGRSFSKGHIPWNKKPVKELRNAIAEEIKENPEVKEPFAVATEVTKEKLEDPKPDTEPKTEEGHKHSPGLHWCKECEALLWVE